MSAKLPGGHWSPPIRLRTWSERIHGAARPVRVVRSTVREWPLSLLHVR